MKLNMKLKSAIAIVPLTVAFYALGCEGPDAMGTRMDAAAPADADSSAPVSELP